MDEKSPVYLAFKFARVAFFFRWLCLTYKKRERKENGKIGNDQLQLTLITKSVLGPKIHG